MLDLLFKLPDGRRLAYHITGAEDGIPLFSFHGWGGSRLTSHPDYSLTEAAGIKLITLDRPGVGLSDPLHSRAVIRWPEDIAALADYLGIDRFAVLGHSAGAPYALACAYQLPDRVLSVTVVSGIGPYSPHARRLFCVIDIRMINLLLQKAPQVARLSMLLARPVLTSAPVAYLYRNFNRPFARDRGPMTTHPMKDMRIRSLREAFRQGIDGIYEDAIVVLRDWGFLPIDVTTPVRLWHGESDAVVGVAFGKQLSTVLPNCTASFHEKCGHHLLYIQWREILEKIKSDSLNLIEPSTMATSDRDS